MIIRKAVDSDANKLNELLTKLILDEKQYDDSIDETFVVINMYENYINDETKFIEVVEENNEIVGYLYGMLLKDPTSKTKKSVLDALYIESNYRKKGLGEKLINDFKTWCKEQKVDKINVKVCAKNINAKKLYNKMGFLKISETLQCEVNK